MITRLSIKDWGPFDQKEVEFQEGSNLIHGINSSGKTSLVNAIYYALTDEVLPTKTQPKDFVKSSSRDSQVELDFKTPSGTYRVERNPRGKKSQLYEMQNGTGMLELANGIDVNKKIADLLGLGPSELIEAVFMKEGNIAEYLASTTAPKRKEFLKSLIRMDRLEDIAKAANNCQKEVSAQEKELKKSLTEERARVNMLKTKPLVGDRTLLDKEIENLETEEKQLIGEKGGLKETADSATKLDHAETRMEDLSGRKKDLLEKITTEQSPFGSIDEINAEIDLIEISDSDLETNVELEKQLSSQRDNIRGRKDLLQEAVSSVEQLKKSGADECPTCHQKISIEILDSIINEKKRDLGAVETELSAAVQAAKEASDQTQTLKKLVDKREGLTKKIENLSSMRTRLGDSDKEIQRLQHEIDELQQKVEGLENIGKIDEKLREIGSKLAQTRTMRDQIMADEVALRDGNAKVAQLEDRETGILKRMAMAKLLKDACEKTIIELGSIPIKKIQELASEDVGQLGLLDGWKLDLEKNILFPIVERGDETIQANTMAGSEKMLIFLALRFSLARSFVNTDFIILDEPTEHLDPERTEKMREFLTTSPTPNQIIVATAEPEMTKSQWSNIIQL